MDYSGWHSCQVRFVLEVIVSALFSLINEKIVVLDRALLHFFIFLVSGLLSEPGKRTCKYIRLVMKLDN